MTIYYDAPVAPDDIIEFVREVPTPSDMRLLGGFPVRLEDDNTVDFGEIIRTNRTARFRSFDGRVHVSQRDSGSDSRVKLLPVSTSLNMGEYERLQQEFARTGGTRTQALERAIYNDAENLTREVQARMEQAWGDVLTDGKLTINENGFQGEADFGVPANHIVAPAALWSDTTNATVLTDIQAWSDTWLATNGSRPARLGTSLAVLRLVQRNKEVIDAVYGSTQGRTRVGIRELNDLLSGENLPTFEEPYDTQVDVDGTSVRTIPDDKVLMKPATDAELGFTSVGVSATALELVNSGKVDMDFEEAAGIVGVVVKEDGVPFRQYTYVDSVQMPILAAARRLLIASVK
jgi:hypothetical protein